jgi:ParB family chromosome partitioning protein
MTATSSDVRTIPISAITILNPRARNKRIFHELVNSIAHLGLKKPISVAERGDGTGYDLICGQGRLEAFIALGETQIPSIVVQATHEDCFVMSLVENLARRNHSPLDLMRAIGDLRKRGYTIAEIASKTDFSDEYIHAICFLLEHGEERLLAAVDRGVIPPTVAMEIARAKDTDIQQALAEAYERKALPGRQVLAIRRIIEQRATSGKLLKGGSSRGSRATPRITADTLVRAYRKQTERQRLQVKKATITQQRLLFVLNALRRLFSDKHFVTLLRAEHLLTLPTPIADRIAATEGA